MISNIMYWDIVNAYQIVYVVWVFDPSSGHHVRQVDSSIVSHLKRVDDGYKTPLQTFELLSILGVAH